MDAMKKLLLATAGLALVAGGVIVLPPHSRGQVQGGREAITVPVAPGQPAGSGATPPALQSFYQDQRPAPTLYPPTSPQLPVAPGTGQVPRKEGDQPNSLREYLSQKMEDLEINKELAVQPSCGEFMICINWYGGPGAAQMAHDLAMELRGPDYHLNAFVFTKGLEERQAELKHIAEIVQKQLDDLAKLNVPCDSVKIKVPLIRYEIQCAVLVGGYRDMESAHRAAEQIKKLNPEPLKQKNIVLHTEGVMTFDKDGKPHEGSMGLVNPFAHALVVRNPALHTERAKRFTAEDLALLQTLNEDEPFSLLKCPRPYTLMVKNFPMPSVTETPQKGFAGLLDKIGLGGGGDKVDAAKVSAHQLADILRKGCFGTLNQHFDAFVLHTRYGSYVTVGNFDRGDDPNLLYLQQELPKLNAQLHPAAQLMWPAVMEVPR
jgi:hypothetical protein